MTRASSSFVGARGAWGSFGGVRLVRSSFSGMSSLIMQVQLGETRQLLIKVCSDLMGLDIVILPGNSFGKLTYSMVAVRFSTFAVRCDNDSRYSWTDEEIFASESMFV